MQRCLSTGARGSLRFSRLGGARSFTSGADAGLIDNRTLQVTQNFNRYTPSGVTATVFGASGYVGHHVVNLLGKIGSQVICPYRGDGLNCRTLKPMGDLGQIVLLPAPLTHLEGLRKSVERSNVVINTIGTQQPTKNYSIYDANVKTAFRVAQVAKEAGVEHFIHFSAMGASHDSPSEFLRAKAESEDVVKSFFPDATILRPAVIFGVQDKFLHRWADLIRYSFYTPMVNGGNSKLQPVDVFDVAQATLNAIGDINARGRTYDIAGKDAYTFNEIMEHLAICMGEDGTNALPMPAGVARIVGTIMQNLPKERWNMLSADLFKQLESDCVVGGSAYRLQDLGVKPKCFKTESEGILLRYKRDHIKPAETNLE